MDPVRNLLQGIIDYAGLFPPTSAPMAEAVAEYATHRHSAENWMLAAFVVPVTRLGEFAGVAAGHVDPEAAPWPLSVLVGPDYPEELDRLAAWQDTNGFAEAVALEFRPKDPGEIAGFVEAAPAVEVFAELPWSADDLEPWLTAVVSAGVRAKIRCGGVTPELVPPVDRVAGFIRECHAAGVGLKFTAGLHHPVRSVHPLTYEPDAPHAMMHGFLNVFVAAALVAAGDCSDLTLLAVLEETEPTAFRADADGVAWRDHLITVDQLGSARSGFARSFGSCSFAEPVQDLQHLGLL